MTITYDPKHGKYVDEADARNEMSRVFDICHDCRRCIGLCPTLPTMFGLIDRHDDHDAGRMTPSQQDQVVDQCYHCKLCYLNCPYTPEQSELAVDFPRLMLRADATRRASGRLGIRSRLTDTIVGHTDVLGKAGSLSTPLANKLLRTQPDSI